MVRFFTSLVCVPSSLALGCKWELRVAVLICGFYIPAFLHQSCLPTEGSHKHRSIHCLGHFGRFISWMVPPWLDPGRVFSDNFPPEPGVFGEFFHGIVFVPVAQLQRMFGLFHGQLREHASYLFHLGRARRVEGQLPSDPLFEFSGHVFPSLPFSFDPSSRTLAACPVGLVRVFG